MKITVILCTYNRCQSLAKALESLAASKLTESVEWEVLVVDNNSSDQTEEVVRGFCRRYPGRFRYLFEPQQGLSSARNAGIRESKSEILAFTDDDVTVEPTWIRNLTAALDSGKWAGAGGRTLVEETFLPPDWMTMGGPHSLGDALAALFDLGLEPYELDRPPYGANMAFRKEMFEKRGLFRTDLGASPNRDIPRSNEDTEFGRRLMAAGEKLRYEPSAVVYHPVLENRIQKSYFLTWFFDYGRAMVREWECGPDILGISRRCFTFFRFVGISLPEAILRWMVTLNPKRRFFRKCRVWTTAGQIVEIYRQWQSARRRSNCSIQGQNHASVPKLSDLVVTSRSPGEKATSRSEVSGQQPCG
jgi:glycosyltransferase involved in cell wall biosynthesis